MGVVFFIGSTSNKLESKNKFILSPETFTQALKAKWKDVEVSQPLTEFFSLDWRCTTNHHKGIWGSLFKDNCTISLEKPDIEDVAEVAVWFRTLVPADIPLEIYNDADAEEFYTVTSETTYLQIMDFYSDPDYMIQVKSVAGDLVDLEKLSLNLKRHWSRLEIFSVTPADPYSFYWESFLTVEFSHEIKVSDSETLNKTYTNDITQTGAVSKDKTTLYLSCFPIAELAKTLIWYRNIIDENIELLVELRSEKKQLILRHDTTAEMIINKFRPHG